MLEPKTQTIEFIITEELFNKATEIAPKINIRRTKASPHDQLIGALGELIAATYLYGDIDKASTGDNKGKVDFEKDNIEIKCSWFPYRASLNLLVREDYAAKRSPNYIQIIIDKKKSLITGKDEEIGPGTKAYICGWASSEEVHAAPLRDFGSKFGGKGGYRCHYIPIANLKPMEELKIV